LLCHCAIKLDQSRIKQQKDQRGKNRANFHRPQHCTDSIKQQPKTHKRAMPMIHVRCAQHTPRCQ
jgi:hypothetical protein